MSTIIPEPDGPSSNVFDVLGHNIRFGLTEDNIAFAVASDFAKAMGHRDADKATRLLAEDEKGTQIVGTPGGPQSMNVIYEDGLWELIFRSTLPGAKAIKKRVKAILREIRQTGRYEVEPKQMDELELAERQVQLILEKRAAEARAEKAESFKAAIEAGDGLTVRSFHKKYFSDVPDRVFFEHLYAHGLLLDQRGKGSERDDGTRRNGSQHRHPSAKGKQYFYLHGSGVFGDKRREASRVRPGQPELQLKALLISQGLAANNNDTGQPRAIEGPTQTELGFDETGAA